MRDRRGPAGLVSGDVITSVNGQAVTSPTALTQSVSGLKPGTKVKLDWETVTGESQTRTVALGAAPAGDARGENNAVIRAGGQPGRTRMVPATSGYRAFRRGW